jgi:hypothetical protein
MAALCPEPAVAAMFVTAPTLTLKAVLVADVRVAALADSV